MSSKRDFFDKPIFIIPNYIYILFFSGLNFVISNVLLIIYYIITFIDPNLFNFLLLFIVLLPLGPSMVALYSTMIELLKEKSISAFSKFFSSYKINLIDSIKIWIIVLSLFMLLIIDFQYFYLNMPDLGIHSMFILLIIYLLAVSLNAVPISASFKVAIKDIIVLSFYYSIKRFFVTLLKMAIIVITLKFALEIPKMLLIFLPSSLCLLFTYYDLPMLKEIEAKAKEAV